METHTTKIPEEKETPVSETPQDTYRRAITKTRENLARSLRLRMAEGRLTEALARDVFADVFGVMAAEEEFGPDPELASLGLEGL